MGSVYCCQCATVLESTYRHHFVQCDCPNETFVDGGDDYTRYGGKDLNKITVMGESKNG